MLQMKGRWNMEQRLLQEINAMRGELIRLVEQGHPVQAEIVVRQSQALDALIAAYLEQLQDGCCKSAAKMLQ